ncbi:MAG: sigma-70 family RNA polymerase sigma factor [Methylomonas sp.]
MSTGKFSTDFNPGFAEPTAGAPLPAIDSLAQNMEQAKQQLLEALLLIPQALILLTAQLSDASTESLDDMSPKSSNAGGDDIVQDDLFVQPDAEVKGLIFLPTQLITVADQIREKPDVDPGQRNRVGECRRQLHKARQQMITANTGLVAFVVYQYKTTSLGFEDLMQEGIIGLIRAVDRFDPNRNIRFSTYAIFWIKQAISRLIVKQDKVVRLPIALAEKAAVVFDVMRRCYLEHNRWPSVNEIQARCELAMEEIKIISSYYQATHSLDASLSDENDDQTLMDSMKQQQFSLPLDEIIDKNLSHYIGKVVASLPEKEAAILNMRFGLKNHREMTLQAIADQLQVTRERVRQIQNEALKKLKQQFGYDLMPFLEPNDSY